MTDEMLELARQNQREAGVENVEFVKGTIEDVPLPDDSVDVIISNCVINLSGDKPARLPRGGPRSAPRRPLRGQRRRRRRGHGRGDAPDMQQWTGCIAGALTRRGLPSAAGGAGFEDVEIQETHRVHEHAASAIIRARVAE